MDPLLAATVRATEEAIINALVAAQTMRGINGNTFYALSHERLREVLRKYHRLVEDTEGIETKRGPKSPGAARSRDGKNGDEAVHPNPNGDGTSPGR
jgi:hypothetical protein